MSDLAELNRQIDCLKNVVTVLANEVATRNAQDMGLPQPGPFKNFESV